MRIEQHISQLLYRYQCVTVPGFGAFLTENRSAQLVQDTNTFYPPKKVLSFNFHLKNNDGLLANHISLCEKIDYDKAVALIEEEVTAWKFSIQKSEALTLKNIGKLSLNSENSLVFEPIDNLNYATDSFGLTSFISPKIKREVYKNEVEKLAVNLAGRKNITEDDIEKYIGVSKDFNVFELQDALGKRDLAKTIRIIHYFEANPKAAPIQMILPALYNYFSKVFMLYSLPSITEQSAAAALGVNPFFVKEYIATARRYDYEGIEKVLLLLHQYNLRSIGVHDAGTSDAGLLKELAVKMIA